MVTCGWLMASVLTRVDLYSQQAGELSSVTEDNFLSLHSLAAEFSPGIFLWKEGLEKCCSHLWPDKAMTQAQSWNLAHHFPLNEPSCNLKQI